MKHCLILIGWLLIFVFRLAAVEPAGYYLSAEGNTDSALRMALFDIIKGHQNRGYQSLWALYRTSDCRNGDTIWDMYSTCTFVYGRDQNHGTMGPVCTNYNREHSVPQNWFSKAEPMRSDAFHIYPTDAFVNEKRSNYPFGECNGESWTGVGAALGKRGVSTLVGYTAVGMVFEPDDAYKGDFARTYFYMATCYADRCNSWGHNVFSNAHDGLTDYAVALFMKWHRQDPISAKEIARNDAVYAYQQNRNPFIDHPELAEYIWGNHRGIVWTGSTGIDVVQQPRVTVVPNPVKTSFTIQGNDMEPLQYQIIDMSGQIVLQGRAAAGVSIAVDVLCNGVYLLRLTAGSFTEVHKLIVAK